MYGKRPYLQASRRGLVTELRLDQRHRWRPHHHVLACAHCLPVEASSTAFPLWASFVIEGPRHRVYFGADSGLWEGFAEIAQRYDGFDLTLLEIGAFHPLWASIRLRP